MSEIKHTPGEWLIKYGDISGLADRLKHYARLISAAPELLEALQSLDRRFRVGIELGLSAEEAYDSFYQEIVIEAIAKATGSQS